MSRYFVDVKNFIQNDPRYTAFIGSIHGANYIPSNHAVMIANVTSFLWIAGIALLLAGDMIFQTLNIPEPEPYKWMKNNKIMVFIGLFIMNNVGNGMMRTGAFEIYVNDVLIYSKLQTGHLPNANDIATALKSVGFE